MTSAQSTLSSWLLVPRGSIVSFEDDAKEHSMRQARSAQPTRSFSSFHHVLPDQEFQASCLLVKRIYISGNSSNLELDYKA